MENMTMKSKLIALITVLVGCNMDPPIDTSITCEGMQEITGGNLGYGNYPDSTASSGPECECSAEFDTYDLLHITVLEAGGQYVDDGYHMPKSHRVEMSSAKTHSVKKPQEGSGREGWFDWYTDYSGAMPNDARDYSGTWTTWLSVITSDGTEIEDRETEVPENDRCADSYNAGFYIEYDGRTKTSGGGTAWSVEEDSDWDGTVTFFTHPEQPLRWDGLLASFLILQSGKPKINGAELTKMSVEDPGSAIGIEIDGVYFDLEERLVLEEAMRFSSSVYVDYGDAKELIPPVLEVSGVVRAGATDAPAEGYVIPSSIIKALGFTQPLVVEMVDNGMMLTAVGSGMSRGTQLDEKGFFERLEGPEGFAISGRAEETEDGLLLSELSASLMGVPLPVGDEVTLKSIRK